MDQPQKEKRTIEKQRIFESDKSKATFGKGVKYLAVALPLLFISPITLTIGFKAIEKSGNYFMIVLGCILTFITIALVTQGIRIILKALFAK